MDAIPSYDLPAEEYSEGEDANLSLAAYFSFKAAGHQFLISATTRSEVLINAAIASIPNSPSVLVGLTNLRGDIIPVYQLGFTEQHHIHKADRILIINKGELALALIVESLPVSQKINPQLIESQLPNDCPFPQLVCGVFKQETYHWVLDGETLGTALVSTSVA